MEVVAGQGLRQLLALPPLSQIPGPSMQDYVKGPSIGYGTYGTVYRAQHKASGEEVALKKFRTGGNGGSGIPQVRHGPCPEH